MFQNGQISELGDYFVPLSKRVDKSIYFYRINGYNNFIADFIYKYYTSALKNGVIIEGKLENPTESNLAYYDEIMGKRFEVSLTFIQRSLKKWLPRMTNEANESVSFSIYDTLETMRSQGKNEGMLRNAYVKFMCWMYYKFERIANKLGTEDIPKILYEGNISNYELKMMSVLSKAGCDIVLLQYNGDSNYLALDGGSYISRKLEMEDMLPFTPDFNIKAIREKQKQAASMERMVAVKSNMELMTNAWVLKRPFMDIVREPMARGSKNNGVYNCFYRVCGAEDKSSYINDLYQMRAQLLNEKRKVVILEREIPKAKPEEISEIKRNQYNNIENLIRDLSSNFRNISNIDLQGLVSAAFAKVLYDDYMESDKKLNRILNEAIYLICWYRRYGKELFGGYKKGDIGCLIYLGVCRDKYEEAFFKFMSMLPTDVMIIVPNLSQNCSLRSERLIDIRYTESVVINEFPKDAASLRMGTDAYQAGHEIDSIINSGVYGEQAKTEIMTLTLQTIHDEIENIWNSEVSLRPNYSSSLSITNVPVIYTKISGVADANVTEYWKYIKKYINADTLVIKSAPYIKSTDANPFKSHTNSYIKNKKLQRNVITESSIYGFGFLRKDIQEHLLDKLQLMIDQKIIKGTFENGMEHTVIATVLNLPKDVLRIMQKLEFRGKNPKLIYIVTTESGLTLEDCIMINYLNLVGIDVMMFVPTGYNFMDKYLNRNIMEEHIIGTYMYDLTVPDFNKVGVEPVKKKKGIKNILFGKKDNNQS